jgi:two-component system cell cycle sensor histidine kinase PleC
VEGSGLGLPIVKGLVEAHGGRVEIESAPARGTTIRLHFPASRVL